MRDSFWVKAKCEQTRSFCGSSRGVSAEVLVDASQVSGESAAASWQSPDLPSAENGDSQEFVLRLRVEADIRGSQWGRTPAAALERALPVSSA